MCAHAREYVCRTVFENFSQTSTPTHIYWECLTCVLAAYSSRNSSRRREIPDKKESISNMEFVVLSLCFFLFFSADRHNLFTFYLLLLFFIFILPDKEFISKYLYIHQYIPPYLGLGVLFLEFFCSFRLRIFLFNYISFIMACIHLPLYFVQMIIILADDLLPPAFHDVQQLMIVDE